MNRRNFLAIAGASLTTAVAGCASRGAVDSEVDTASAKVIGMEKHPEAVEATIEVTNKSTEGGSMGLHVHYWHDDHLGHTHYPTVYVEAGETKTITDTFQHSNAEDIDRVTAHIHGH